MNKKEAKKVFDELFEIEKYQGKDSDGHKIVKKYFYCHHCGQKFKMTEEEFKEWKKELPKQGENEIGYVIDGKMYPAGACPSFIAEQEMYEEQCLPGTNAWYEIMRKTEEEYFKDLERKKLKEMKEIESAS